MEKKLENLGFEVTLDLLGDSSLFADPLFSLQSPSKANDKNRGGFIDRQRKGVGVGAHSALVSKLVRFFSLKKINCCKKFWLPWWAGASEKKQL